VSMGERTGHHFYFAQFSTHCGGVRTSPGILRTKHTMSRVKSQVPPPPSLGKHRRTRRPNSRFHQSVCIIRRTYQISRSLPKIRLKKLGRRGRSVAATPCYLTRG
jgi:hypothetical protein